MSLDGTQGQRFASAPVPKNERSRLEELHLLEILDTAFEERFDRYTELVASLFQFPICLISLVDEDRQWFKSAHGLEFRETKRDRSFCAHALAQGDTLVIPDASVDPRFADNPLVRGKPYLRFYAGALVHGPHGLPLGTLCLLDHKPRHFGDRDCGHLRQFAALAERELLRHHELRETRHAARQDAYFDALTGLPNRRLLEDRLESLVQLARAQDGAPFVLLHIDIVDFLRVNRSLGREAGDCILRELADRLRGLCPAEGTVARLQADRFAMIAPRTRYEELESRALIFRLARELSRPVYIDEREQFLRLRIGVSVCQGQGDTGAALLERAAGAARSSGDQLITGVSVHFHDHRMEADLKRRFELETRIRSGIEHRQFHLAYQPVFDISSDRVASLEALVRWREPELGEVPPGEFIPLAEATGLILPLGEWILAEALRQHRQWRDQGIDPPPVHVNLSARELEHPDFIERVTGLLEKNELPGEALSLEITETVLVHDLDANAEKMRVLTQLGVRFYVDDFGKGYSSLQYLRRLPFSALKIDRAFVSQVTENPDDEAITKAVIALARTLGITVIAEGVETREQLEFLKAAGCTLVQGFLLGKPATADDVVAMICG